MTVYVDDMRAKFGRMKMCHMIADTHDELEAMAERIGVAARWIQHVGEAGEHYDICLSKVQRALDFGAVPITWRQTAIMCRRRRLDGILGTPEDAQRWFDAQNAVKP